MCTIQARLKEERLRLQYSQTGLAAVGGVGKTTQINYEKGERKPDSAYLSAVSEVGVDVLYVLLGSRSLTMDLDSEESALLNTFRHLGDQQKKSVSEISRLLKNPHHGVDESAPVYQEEKPQSIAEMVAENSPDVEMLKGVIERVERILTDEQMTLSPEQKARVIVACIHAIQSERGGSAATHISTAIRAVL